MKRGYWEAYDLLLSKSRVGSGQASILEFLPGCTQKIPQFRRIRSYLDIVTFSILVHVGKGAARVDVEGWGHAASTHNC